MMAVVVQARRMVQHVPSQVFRLVTAGLVGVGLFAVLILIAGTGAVHAKLSDASDDISVCPPPSPLFYASVSL